MNKLLTLFFTLFFMNACTTEPNGKKFLIETSLGEIYVVLYDDTPLHRNNFEKLANSNYYNDITFHRVIKDFMVQAGDSRTALSDSAKFDKENVIDAEFRFPTHFHKAGALAAARWGDEENPEKKSDAFQFYIVTGEKVYEHDLKLLEKERFERLKQTIYKDLQKEAMDTIKVMYKDGRRSEITSLRASILDKADEEADRRKEETVYPTEVKEIYTQTGGAPHLDGEYTVFGEVYKGFDVVRKIEAVDTNVNDKPLQPVIIKSVTAIN